MSDCRPFSSVISSFGFYWFTGTISTAEKWF